MKILVTYYTKSENTGKIAEAIRSALVGLGDVEVFRIQMANDYCDCALHFNPRVILDVFLNKKPKMKTLCDFTKYDFVIIGSPIWFGKIAPPVNTLIQNAVGIENKWVIGFVSSTLNHSAYEKGLRVALETRKSKVLKVFSLKDSEITGSVIQEIGGLVSRS
jgi:menaquinone-dependent protoporphyrinogen IX oxidase